MSKSINVYKFLEQFEKEYNFLYDHNDNVGGYRQAVKEFDQLIEGSEGFRRFVGEFCKNVYHDMISSDREAAAFMFALKVLG